MKVTVEILVVTPVMAAKWLKRCVPNRPIRTKTVAAYARDMAAGNWVTTHQGIAFNDEGELMDGQHRLLAVVASGCTIKMLVTRGLPAQTGETKTMDVMDRGAIRSIADQLRLQHGIKDQHNVVAVATQIVRLCLGKEKSVRYTVPQMVALLELFGADIQAVVSRRSHMIPALFKPAVLGGIAWARRAHPRVDEFFDQYSRGFNLTEHSPALHLREYMIARDRERRRLVAIDFGTRSERHSLALLGLEALRAHVAGEPLKSIKPTRAGLEYFEARLREPSEKVRAIFVLKGEVVKGR